jgi:hypothetical protein
MLENPIILAALICFFLGLALSCLARVVPGPAFASVVLPIIFLASYVLTYQQVPDFPPIGATNKIFYIALAAALVGFALDLLPRPANYRRPLAVVVPLLIVAWIGFPRFAKPDIELIATALGLWLGGIVLLLRLDIVATTPAERNGGSIVGTAMLMALMLAFAPIALWRFFHQFDAMPRYGGRTCGRRALGTYPPPRRFWRQCGLWCRGRTSGNDRHGDVDHQARRSRGACSSAPDPICGRGGRSIAAAAEAIPWARPPGSCRDPFGFACSPGGSGFISSPF